MHIGFTGTRYGLQRRQRLVLKDFLQDEFFDGMDDGEEFMWFHHGDCIGADAEAHCIASNIGYDVWLHPPDRDNLRAMMKRFVHKEKRLPYLQRNDRIVEMSGLVIGCPQECNPVPRSGTWYTIRQAYRQHKRVVVIKPDGEFKKLKCLEDDK